MFLFKKKRCLSINNKPQTAVYESGIGSDLLELALPTVSFICRSSKGII